MPARQLNIAYAVEFTPRIFPDSRGLFACPYIAQEVAEATGRSMPVAQTNHSVSGRGVLRGVHYADVPPGQAKYVHVAAGRGIDVLVDLRVGSPTFGEHEVIELDAQSLRAVYVPEGVGHAFFALSDNTVLSYLCSTGYDPSAEHGVHPLDPALGLPWPDDLAPIMSAKDSDAPSLHAALSAGALPSYQDCLRVYTGLD